MNPDIVIPHHNRSDLLEECLKSIPMDFNVFVIRGGAFAENCNRGFRLTRGEYVIFLNDDCVVNEQGLRQMVELKTDIVGSPLIYPDGSPQMYGVETVWNWNTKRWKNILTNDSSKADYPSGAFFKIRRSVFKKLGQFSEDYRNGAEDRELFMKAILNRYSISYVDMPSIHHLSVSESRMAYSRENDKIFASRFGEKEAKRLYKILNKL